MLPKLSSNSTIKLLLTAIFLIATAALAAGARGWLASPAKAEAASTKPRTIPSPILKAASDQERVETELITITAVGFEPAEITRPQGSFFLEVDNRSGLAEVDLRLDSEQGHRVHQKSVQREQLDWYQPLDLHPGRYVLTEANHPDWVCRIIITAR